MCCAPRTIVENYVVKCATFFFMEKLFLVIPSVSKNLFWLFFSLLLEILWGGRGSVYVEIIFFSIFRLSEVEKYICNQYDQYVFQI